MAHTIILSAQVEAARQPQEGNCRRRGFPLKTPREKWEADWGGNGGGHQLEQINPTFHRVLQKHLIPPIFPLQDPLKDPCNLHHSELGAVSPSYRNI